jgi:hypothetical protein
MESVKKIKKTIEKALKQQGTYSKDMDTCIHLCASTFQAFQLAQEDIEKLPNTYVEEVTREGNIKLTPHPAFKVLVSTGEITRRSLRELGLTINSVAGTSGEDDVEDLIESVQKLKKNE